MFEHHAMRRAEANPTQIHNIYITFQSYDLLIYHGVYT